MNKRKWSIVLSVVSLCLAIGMSALGARQYEIDHRYHPEYFYHGKLYYSPTAQWVSYCLNAPPYAITSLVDNFVMRHRLLPSIWIGHYCFYLVPYEYYLVLFLFWWWVGWKIDMKLSAGKRKRSWAIVESFLGIVLSVLLLFYGITSLENRNLIQAIVISTVVWGVLLLWYFVLHLWGTPPLGLSATRK